MFELAPNTHFHIAAHFMYGSVIKSHFVYILVFIVGEGYMGMGMLRENVSFPQSNVGRYAVLMLARSAPVIL